MRIRLDGRVGTGFGRDKVKKLKIEIEPSAIEICVPAPDASGAA